jgi:protein KRI1
MRRRKQARDLRKATEGGEDGENTVNASGKVSLFDDDQDEALDFTVNDKFKKRFEHNETLKDKMRLKELEEELGDEDETSESSEDEDGELLTQDINNTILQTLARIKNKDPVIYKPNAKFFTKDDDDEDDDDATPTLKQKKEKKEKKITVVDMERERILRGDAGEHDSEEEQEHAHEDEEDEGYYEKQKRIKQAFKRAAEPESEDDLFVPRTRTKEEEAKEEEDFSEFARERLADKARDPSGTQCTCFTGTKVPILTLYIYSRMYVCVYVCMYVCMYIYIHIYIYHLLSAHSSQRMRWTKMYADVC